ncbi:caldesmon, putative [Entamoeba dispar SAW760]|uniref:Caldesmon, putative n=1 Tax=Entamoeba dispar (strain ATCC PRA-260 / SAW760) TaxID=370354 RepID=B0ENJ9_ENTDS|nr:caldesmon, putative [Entamoeba dispar SAW760]EDR23880.1 caldesmon, putative [Entamoeba dispar SAW760]|eukprot:EDR23880.1 caldesmon, putative [Entamoeba dispar SAW760]
MEKTINKATDPADSFPKDKHVRKLICSCSTEQYCVMLYHQLLEKIKKGTPVTQMKALEIIHRIMLDGPQQACTTKTFNLGWIPELDRFKRSQPQNVATDLFLKFIRVLESKVELHTNNQFIPGSMDPDLFKKIIGRMKINSYESVSSIVEPLMKHLRVCQDNTNAILKVLNVKRILSLMAMLVTLMRELNGIYYMFYEIIFNTFVSLHHDQRYKDLISQFNTMHYDLKNIFDQISVIRDVTALVTVPQLSSQPPDFSVITLGHPKSPTPPPKEPTPPPKQEPQQPIFEPFDFNKFEEVKPVPQQPTIAPFDFAKEEEQKKQPVAIEKEKEVIVKVEKVVDMDRINKLLKRIKELEEQINELKITIDQLKAKHKRELKQLNEEKESGNNDKIKELEAIIEQLKKEVEEWKGKSEETEELKKELAKKEDEIKELKEIQQQLNEKEKQLKEEEEKRKEVENELNQLKEVIAKETQLKEEFSHKVEEAQKIIKELEKQLEELKLRENNLGENEKKLIQELEEQKKELENWKKKEEEWNEYKKKKELENETMKVELKKLQDKNHEYIMNIEQLNKEKEDKIKELKELELKVNEMEQKYEILEKEREEDYWRVVGANVKGVEKEFEEMMKNFNDMTIEGNKNASKENVLRDLTILNATGNAYRMALEQNHPKEAEKELENFHKSMQTLLEDLKGVEPKIADEAMKLQLRQATSDLYDSVKVLMNKWNDREHVNEAGDIFNINMTKEKTLVEGIEEVAEAVNFSGIDDDAERELLKAADSINGLAKDLEKWLKQSKKGVSAEMDVNQAIMESAQAIAKATAALVNAAALAQKERVALGKKLATPTKPYAPNQVWSEGLVTAGKAVAEATKEIVTVANNNVTPGCEKNEDALIASSREVAKATVQLVTAARSKADFDSPTLGKVESASKSVKEATELLVKAVNAISGLKEEKDESVDFSKLTDYQLIVKEREAQIKVLKLRRELDAAEKKLKDLNKQRYERQNN